MALYHFHADLIRRSKGQSVVAAAAYRAGEKLRCDYYGNEADYTRKKGVVLTDILLPPLAPKEYADRETLWNAVEQAEKNAKAQLAYSYDIALQNELSIEENIALARQFLQEQFVSKGMIVDFAVHTPDLESGGIPNPHFHVLCPVRPIDETGKWGAKQRREYVIDEQGQRIRDEAGNYVWNAVPTTDWGAKGTLLHWREEWAGYVNRALERKGLPCRIDHRSYADRGMEETPTVHEGPTVRAMEAKGIQTDVGNLNRWIRSTNAAISESAEENRGAAFQAGADQRGIVCAPVPQTGGYPCCLLRAAKRRGMEQQGQGRESQAVRRDGQLPAGEKTFHRGRSGSLRFRAFQEAGRIERKGQSGTEPEQGNPGFAQLRGDVCRHQAGL